MNFDYKKIKDLVTFYMPYVIAGAMFLTFFVLSVYYDKPHQIDNTEVNSAWQVARRKAVSAFPASGRDGLITSCVSPVRCGHAPQRAGRPACSTPKISGGGKIHVVLSGDCL